MQASAKIVPSNEVKFSRLSGEADLNNMIAKSREEIQQRITSENHELKACLKMLQKEMFEIVKLKSDIYMKRFKAENFNPSDSAAYSSEEVLKHELEQIRENLFNLPFLDNQKEIVKKFRENFSQLKEFMKKIDKGMGDLRVFN